MSDDEFYRIKRLPPYVIAEVNAMRAAARAGGEDIIDLGMGNPDLPPPQHVIDKLVEVAQKPSSHGYSQSMGIPGLRKAQANYYGRRFGVELDPETEVVVTMGSKEGLASLATAITAPGDVVLAPNPSYPIHMFGFIIAGATIRSVPTTPDEGYWRALDRAMAFTVPRPSVLVVGYPSNPTAETVDLAFYERLVAWARENKVWVLSDLAYSELYYDGNPTPSILQVPGAKDVAVEFTSLSKTYSMAGWRIGFAVGNKKLISALKRVKSYLDYGAFTPIQAAACAALNGPQDIVAQNRELYHKRRDVLVESFGRAGWDIPAPKASMFAWAPLPPALKEMGSLEFSKQLLTHANVAVAPGVGYGEDGEGYVRIAMVENEQRLRQAARNVKRYLQSMGINTPAGKEAVVNGFTALTTTEVSQVAHTIQLAVAPVFLLAGIVAFINVCASRLARVIDRARVVEKLVLETTGEEHDRLIDEIRVLDTRIKVVNRSIMLSVLSSLLVCAVVILLFASSLFDVNMGTLIALLFIGSMLSIGSAFAIFIYETRLGSRVIHIRNEILYHRAENDEGGMV